MKWHRDDLNAVQRALESARDGNAAVVTITGEPGMGKSSLLAEVVRMAERFHVLMADGQETTFQEPYSLLHRLGLHWPETVNDAPPSPLVAAQDLRELADRMSRNRPVLFIVDDLHEVDPESAEALYWLYQRSSKDRVAIAAAVRTRALGQLGVWDRLAVPGRQAERIDLVGLDFDRAAELIGGFGEPPADDDVRRLIKGTGGNPLYLTSLLRRYRVKDLAGMAELPAPAEVIESVRAQLRGASPDAAAILNAIAVLGHAWWDRPLVAAVADVEHPIPAADLLIQRSLVVTRGPEPGAPIRTYHALVRAAVYQSIPADDRHALHLRAARHLGPGMAALEHRVAAIQTYDDELAGELAEAGRLAAESIEFRRAAQLYRWASVVTSEPEQRERRRLESLYQSVAAQDVAKVRPEILALDRTGNPVRTAIVAAALHVAEKDCARAAAILDNCDPDSIAPAGEVWRYRWAVLLMHARLRMGQDTDRLVDLLEIADAAPARDLALEAYHAPAAGEIALRQGRPEAWAAAINAIPGDPRLTPPQSDGQLLWRGVLYEYSGASRLAEADLAEVVSRIRRGRSSQPSDRALALLGLARWQLGDWNRASIDIDLAFDTAIGAPHPLAPVIRTFRSVIRGDLSLARDQLSAVERLVREEPWPAVAHLFAAALTVCAHASGEAAEKRDVLPRLQAAGGSLLTSPASRSGAFVLMHLTVAALWADDLALAKDYLARIADHPFRPGWLSWGQPWLQALVAESEGHQAEAVRLIGTSLARPAEDLPLYQAHARLDSARMLEAAGRGADARPAARAAVAEYRRLGAVPYINRISQPGQPRPAEPVLADVFAPLSQRERDVATLAVSGFSYAQIARELYLSSSTVRFHLSNIYAKTATSGRHDLTDLARRAGVLSSRSARPT